MIFHLSYGLCSLVYRISNFWCARIIFFFHSCVFIPRRRHFGFLCIATRKRNPTILFGLKFIAYFSFALDFNASILFYCLFFFFFVYFHSNQCLFFGYPYDRSTYSWEQFKKRNWEFYLKQTFIIALNNMIELSLKQITSSVNMYFCFHISTQHRISAISSSHSIWMYIYIFIYLSHTLNQ